MRIAVLPALAAVSLLGACREGAEDQSNTSASTTAASASGAASAPARPSGPVTKDEAARIFHERHEGMEQIGKSMKAMRHVFDIGNPDPDSVRAAAAMIAQLAAKSSGWFPAGTGRDVLPKTRALPAIWQKPDDFAAKNNAFRKAAQRMDATARGEDMSAMKSSYAALGKTCKACHDTYRAEEHPK
jgi:cytochrome c556